MVQGRFGREARSLRRFAEEAAVGSGGLDAGAWRDRTNRHYRELEATFDELVERGQAAHALAMPARLLVVALVAATGWPCHACVGRSAEEFAGFCRW
jgi:hypothetical protein